MFEYIKKTREGIKRDRYPKDRRWLWGESCVKREEDKASSRAATHTSKARRRWRLSIRQLCEQCVAAEQEIPGQKLMSFWFAKTLAKISAVT